MSGVFTVADLTDEHIGWYMQIELTPIPGDLFQKFHRSIELGEVRRWEYRGEDRVGLLDVSSKRPGIAGTEYHDFKNDAKVILLRQVRKPRRKRNKP